jgi:hypothetical protein
MFNFLESTQYVFRRVRKIFFAKADDVVSSLDSQDLSRFSEQDIILESEADIQKYLPDVLGQALARTWIDKRFLDAFFDYPVEILERGGVYLPEKIQLEFIKEEKSRPKVTVFEKTKNGRKKILELKLIMVAEQ